MSKSVAYLMRKTEEGYEVLGMPEERQWLEPYRFSRLTDEEREAIRRAFRKEQKIARIKAQPFF